MTVKPLITSVRPARHWHGRLLPSVAPSARNRGWPTHLLPAERSRPLHAD